MNKLVLLVVIIALSAYGEYVHKKVKTKSEFIYAGKFCFDTSGNLYNALLTRKDLEP